MNLILSETFLSLPREKQQALAETNIAFYYPNQQEMIMADKELRKNAADTLANLDSIT